MGSFGGGSFFGGTCLPGGGVSAEDRYYRWLQEYLGEGATDQDRDDELEGVRARFLYALARELATIEAVAIQAANESVPSASIESLEDWERAMDSPCADDLARGTAFRQDVLAALMKIQGSMCTPNRVEEVVEDLMIAGGIDPGGEVYVGENTGATAVSDDGVRYWSVLLPATTGNKPGEDWMNFRKVALYQTIKRILERWQPAHCKVALCTGEDSGTPGVPAFYCDGYLSCECGKDCLGS